MRRLLAVAVALVFLSPAAACGSTGSTTPDAASSAGPSAEASSAGGVIDRAAATAQACAEAVPLSEKAAARLLAALTNAVEPGSSGSEVDVDKVLQPLQSNLDAWAARLTELSRQPIEEPVKAALTDSATAIKELAKPTGNTQIGQAERTLNDIYDKIKTACA